MQSFKRLKSFLALVVLLVSVPSFAMAGYYTVQCPCASGQCPEIQCGYGSKTGTDGECGTEPGECDYGTYTLPTDCDAFDPLYDCLEG